MAQINKPTDYFNTNLWTADDSNPRSITSTHATDFVWIKSRNQTYIHRLFDSVRGATKRLRSNGTDAEDTASTEVTAFTSTGYTIDSGLNSTDPSTNWVGWSWLGGGTASSNTDGSITSQVSANTTSGFSIVSYTGNATAGATVGHGLGTTPSLMIFKDRDNTRDWIVYHKDLGATKFIKLNLTDASGTASAYFNDTEPTSSLFTVGSGTSVNNSGTDYISYCFAEKKGYSKFGSYTGNGSTDGTFVYTGFKPAFVMMKRTNTTGEWGMFDNKRDSFNVATAELKANASDAEEVNGAIDFLSQGFKLKATSAFMNASGSTYIYMAFAENPLVGTNNIPATAR